jgi:hypothetical protein
VHLLAPVIHDALPRLSLYARAVVGALLLTGGSIGTSHEVATRLGLPNRFRLRRMLEANGLPPLHRLSGWITVLGWVWQWESNKVSLSRAALRADREPAACYRLVKRITSMSWKQVRTAGVDGVMGTFLAECDRLRSSAACPDQPIA